MAVGGRKPKTPFTVASLGAAASSTYTPPVDYNPGQNPDIVSIKVGENKFKESTTPLPDVIRADELVETDFAQFLADDDAEARRQRQGEMENWALGTCGAFENVIENALRLTPAGGRIDVHLVLAHRAIVEIAQGDVLDDRRPGVLSLPLRRGGEAARAVVAVHVREIAPRPRLSRQQDVEQPVVVAVAPLQIPDHPGQSGVDVVEAPRSVVAVHAHLSRRRRRHFQARVGRARRHRRGQCPGLSRLVGDEFSARRAAPTGGTRPSQRLTRFGT